MTISISTPTSNTGSIQNNSTDVLTIGSDNSVSIDTNTLHVDATNNRVGIGTSSPGTPLHTVQTGQSSVALFQNTNASWASDVQVTYSPSGSTVSTLGFSARSDGSTWTTSNYGDMIFITGTSGSGFERMRIDSSGYVTTPNQPSASLLFNDTTNLGTTGSDHVNSNWTYDFPFTTAWPNRGITVVNDGTRNSRITLPVSGRYEVSIDLFLNITSSLRAFGTRLLKNGSVIANFTWDSFAHVSGTTHPHAGYTFIFDASANDYITVQFTAYDAPGYYLINANSLLGIKLIG